MSSTLTEKKIFSLRNNLNHDCPFCSMKREPSDYLIAEFHYGSLHLNYNQSYEGRCLYIPHDHFENVNELNESLYLKYNKEILLLSKILLKACSADLMNIAMLGNKVRHIHWHLIPRYENDFNWGKAPWPTQEKTLTKSSIERIKQKIKNQLHLLPLNGTPNNTIPSST